MQALTTPQYLRSAKVELVRLLLLKAGGGLGFEILVP